jgi:excisionase family DNA binding protein
MENMRQFLSDNLFAEVPETAEILQIDERTVRRAIERGNIPATRIGQRWRIPTSWLRKTAGLGDVD